MGLSPAEVAQLRTDPSFVARASAMFDAFRGASGELALETILQASIFAPPVDRSLAGEAYLRFAQQREGENKLACSILFYLQQHDLIQRTKDNDRPEPDASADAAGEERLYAAPLGASFFTAAGRGGPAGDAAGDAADPASVDRSRGPAVGDPAITL